MERVEAKETGGWHEKTVSFWSAVVVILIFQSTVYSLQPLFAQIPGILNYQGRVAMNGTNFNGTGQFKFALMDGTGATTYWSNGVNAVTGTVTKGLYSMLLGDTGIPNMAALPASVFTNSDVRLRVWFDGGSGLQQLSPDQRIVSAGYSLMAASVPDGSVTAEKLAAGSVGSSQLASNLTVSGTLTLCGDVVAPRLNIGSGHTLNGALATIAGGTSNTAAGAFSAVGGGYNNTASHHSTIGGGYQNAATNWNGTVGGGAYNSANGRQATVPGGSFNEASGVGSFAAGSRAKANHDGAFVWADQTEADFSSTAANQFLIRASGGVGIGTTTPTHSLVVQKRSIAEPAIMIGGAYAGGPRLQTYGLSDDPLAWMGLGTDMGGGPYEHSLCFPVGPATNGVQTIGSYDGTNYSEKMRITATGNVGIGNTNPTNKLMVVDARCDGSSWINASDRNLKKGFLPVDSRDILAKAAALPITTWTYKDNPKATHVGPVAQDFRAAFGLGADDTGISTVDADGVALAAIQGLYEVVKDEVGVLRAQLLEQKARNDALERRLAELEAKIH